MIILIFMQLDPYSSQMLLKDYIESKTSSCLVCMKNILLDMFFESSSYY